MEKPTGPQTRLPAGALHLLFYLARCEEKGLKPNLDRKGRALHTLRDRGHIHPSVTKTTARGRRLLAAVEAGRTEHFP